MKKMTKQEQAKRQKVALKRAAYTKARAIKQATLKHKARSPADV